MDYVLDHVGAGAQDVLDPFAGSGVALFASRDRGCRATGIELLPVGAFLMRARLAAERTEPKLLRKEAANVARLDELNGSQTECFPHLRITKGAFPAETEGAIARYRGSVRERVRDADVRVLLDLACLSVLERVSYTRKDGQYLRWDRRARPELRGNGFDKGHIWPFQQALQTQLSMMCEDLAAIELFAQPAGSAGGCVEVLEGSCLEILPRLPGSSFDLVITSPPYCNRYDYTRTYALELAYLGIDERGLKHLRQAMLSCTVENRAKEASLRRQYASSGAEDRFDGALSAFRNQSALHEVLEFLDCAGAEGSLNNANIPRMVRNYFLELSVVLFELARMVRPDGHVVMVNDNVQYAGEEVPVDLILCDLAQDAGFVTERIWTLPRGKGNSSQQMGRHGRNELRKCAYIWRRER